jgi:hypothetical protein
MYDPLVGLSLNEATEQLKQTNTKFRILYEDRENILTADFDPNRVEVYIASDGTVSRTSRG